MSSYGFPKKAEDSASANADDLCPIAGVRTDVPDTAKTGTDGDYGTIAINKAGSVLTQVESTLKPAFSCTTTPIAPAASTTDWAQLYGSGTKTVKVHRIIVNYTAASGTTPNDFYLVKRSTANSSGTSATPTVCPLDSSNTATAVVKSYTGNPTTGTLVANINCESYQPEINGVVTPNPYCIFDEHLAGGPIVLRGTGEGVCLNNNGASVANTTPKVSATFFWTEE